MRNEFVLNKSDSICKTCGGIGILSAIAGLIMCVLLNGALLALGLMLFNFGVVMLTEVCMYLFEIPRITLKFANSIFVIGIGLAIVGAYCLFATIMPAVISLIIIGVGDVMMLMQRYN